jgi:anaphase-promoting complex subunit 2
VLEVYVSTIRALHVIDPKGLLLHRISQPVCAYLQRRSDTVRQIVTALTDSADTAGSELLAALSVDARGGGRADGTYDARAGGDGGGGAQPGLGLLHAATLWTPAPTELEGGGGLASARARADVLSILVGIYGSPEVFVAEYRLMLADRALSMSGHTAAALTTTVSATTTAATAATVGGATLGGAQPNGAGVVVGSNLFDADRERRHIELLKLRFGESALQGCEVMLRDMTDSRRIARTINEAATASATAPARAGSLDAQLNVTILSRLSWPQLSEEAFDAHPLAERAFGRFQRQYAHLKSPRKLLWKRSLGSVTLDVELGCVAVRDVTCSPLQASLLLHFADRPRWALSELAAALKLDAPTLRKRLAHWLNHECAPRPPRPANARSCALRARPARRAPPGIGSERTPHALAQASHDCAQSRARSRDQPRCGGLRLRLFASLLRCLLWRAAARVTVAWNAGSLSKSRARASPRSKRPPLLAPRRRAASAHKRSSTTTAVAARCRARARPPRPRWAFTPPL